MDEAQHAVTGLFMADALHDSAVAPSRAVRLPVLRAIPRSRDTALATAVLHLRGHEFLVVWRLRGIGEADRDFFAVVLLYQWFLLVEELQDSYTAAICTAVLGLLPTMLVFEKTIMLEIPSLALGVGAFGTGSGTWTGPQQFPLRIWCLARCGTVVQADQRVPAGFLSADPDGDEEVVSHFPPRNAGGCGTWWRLLAGPFLVLMLYVQGNAVANDLSSHRMSGFERIRTTCARCPPHFRQLCLLWRSWGCCWPQRWNKRGQAIMMVCWIVAGYVTFSFFGQREPRFAIYWFPPLVYFRRGAADAILSES